MSTFNGVIKELENVLIDNFTRYKSHTCFFLSHCHTDHMNGLYELFLNANNNSNYHLYCSPISRLILINKYGFRCKNVIKELSSGEVITVPENDFAPSYLMTVTPIPAGHCPGSIMFLFETKQKTILYTGDFRISKNDFTKFQPFSRIHKLKLLDELYFDSTFLNENYWDFPLRSEVSNKLLNLIQDWTSKSPDHNVLLEVSALYGYEFVFVEIARKLKYKIHVRDALYDIFWNVPEIGTFLTKHCTGTKLHAFKRFDTKCSCGDKILLTIRLSAMWYRSGKGMSKPPIWKEFQSQRINLCYSTHSSCSEIVDFLNYLKPKSLKPCVIPVDSNEADMIAYLKELTSSWETVEEEEKKPTKADFPLERNYRFKLKFPPCRSEDFDDFEISSEKKKKIDSV